MEEAEGAMRDGLGWTEGVTEAGVSIEARVSKFTSIGKAEIRIG